MDTVGDVHSILYFIIFIVPNHIKFSNYTQYYKVTTSLIIILLIGRAY